MPQSGEFIYTHMTAIATQCCPKTSLRRGEQLRNRASLQKYATEDSGSSTGVNISLRPFKGKEIHALKIFYFFIYFFYDTVPLCITKI